MKLQLLIIAVCLASYVCISAEEKTFESYAVKTPDSVSLVEMAKAIAGEDNKVVYDPNTGKLLVFATPEIHASLKKFLKDVNKLPQNIMLEVRVHEAGKISQSSASAGLQGSVVISGSGARADVKASPSAKAQSTKINKTTAQKLLLRSGGEAVINIGKEVPDLNYLLVLGQNWGYIKPEVTIKKVGASLRAKAAVIGNSNLITVTLTPELSGLVGNKITRIRYVKMATTVTVRNGETLTIGSFGNNKNFYKHFLAGYADGAESKDMNITLTANIMKPDGRIQ